jgi:hypothetical protein
MNAAVRQAFEQGLGDAKVRSISWTDDDLLLNLALPGLPVRNLCLCFKMIAHLKMDFDYGEYVGQPLLFSAEAKEMESGSWAVRFDFGAAPEGKIEFECNEILQVSLTE